MDSENNIKAVSGSLEASLDSAERELSDRFAALAGGPSDNTYSDYNTAAAAVEALKTAYIDGGDLYAPSITHCNCRGSCYSSRCACINAGFFCGFLCRKGVHHECRNIDRVAAAPRRWPQLEQETTEESVADQRRTDEPKHQQLQPKGEASSPATLTTTTTTTTNILPLSKARPTRIERHKRKVSDTALRRASALREARDRDRTQQRNRLRHELGMQKYSWMTDSNSSPPPA
jgi:hypothetical protein